MSGARVWVLRAALLAPVLPLAAGQRMVTYQDAIMTHLPAKAATVEQARRGVFPYLNPYASFGEPLAGNPNFGTFFPDMAAFLLLPLPVAFGLRFALAAVLGFAGARRWARAEGATRPAAEVAAVAFVLSGVFVSTWRFFNSGLALALAPWVVAAAARVSARVAAGVAVRRGVAELGLVAGLEVLAGEPVIALMTFGLAGLRGLMTSLRTLPAIAGGLVLGGALAAPQVASTWQVYATSTRSLAPFPFVLASATSVTPARLLEQVTPFPFGRPDLTGEAGFSGHVHFDNHAPYVWTLHVGWVVVLLLLLCARPAERRERWWWAVLALAAVLSAGRYLPAAKELHAILSLGGRMRFPVKWWYVVALALVPLVAWAAGRWDREGPAKGLRRVAAALLVATGVFLLGFAARPSGVVAVAGALSAAAALALVVAGRRLDTLVLAVLTAVTLGLSHAPLWRTFVDEVPDPAPRFAGGRVYERVAGRAHPMPHAPDWPPPERTTREVFRRATREMWALTGSLGAMPYAFDGDPDGIYFEGDRVVGKSIDSLPWADRAGALRASGVEYVVGPALLPAVFAPLAVLASERGVTVYRLAGMAPSVRMATRLLPAVRFEDVVPLLSRPDFAPSTDAVVMAEGGTITGAALPSRVEILEEEPARLRARVEAPAAGVLVWSRTFFEAWRARVDGAPAPLVVADGHLVGVHVPAGTHEVTVAWSRGPLLAGAAVSLLAALGMVVLRWR